MNTYLLPELVHYIAQLCPRTWISLSQVDKQFSQYSLFERGWREFSELFTVKEVRIYRTSYIVMGILHRGNDLPVVIISGWYQGWYWHGKFHRDNDRPAEIWKNKYQRWYRNGKLHRDNAAANIQSNGQEDWYQNGVHAGTVGRPVFWSPLRHIDR
jgi:hypothetical protein